MSEIEKKEQTGEAGVILDPPPVKRPLQCTYWCFTLNNYAEEQVEQLEQVLKHECKWFVFQEEVGKEGTPHLQGTLCLMVKQRLAQLKCINPAIHWEATKAVKASIAYCTKKDTATGRVYVYGIELPKEIEIEKPYGWQLEVLDIATSVPDKRTIHWFWEPKGGVGKTTLCKYLVVKMDALMLTGKSADMYHMLAKYPNKRELIIVDCPRSMQDYINYGAIEQIKNGLIFSGKYEGAQLVFNCPHVICFSNSEPYTYMDI
jgi:hypothetical protein